MAKPKKPAARRPLTGRRQHAGYKLSGIAQSCAVQIRLNADDAEKPCTWIQVAYEGAWRGHVVGPFDFQPSDLAQMVANFQRHPSYRPGAEADPEGVARGDYDVIAFDWRHASEMPPGTVPMAEQVARGWALDMAVRAGTGGKAELWALARPLDEARELIKQQAIKWCSVTAYPHAIDPVSGEDIGWYISSIAYTNDPFLQGMEPMAAERRAAAARALGYYPDPYNTPTTAEELVCALRELFELPATADLGALLGEIAKLRSWVLGGISAPAGVDIDELVGVMRKLFNLPTLSTPAQIFAASDDLLAALAEQAREEAAEQPQPGAVGYSRERGTIMPSDFIVTCANRFKIPANEAEVQAAIITRLEAGDGATKQLSAILNALGVENPDEAMKKIAAMFKSVDALEKAMPELSALREGSADDEEKTASKDVDQAMTAYRMPAAARPALLGMRTGGAVRPAKGAEPAAFVAYTAARTAARARFTAEYPPIDASKQHLTQPQFAGPHGGPQLPAHVKVEPIVVEAGGGPGSNGSGNLVTELANAPGRNRFEKALSVAAREGGEGWRRLSYDQKHYAAKALLARVQQAETQ